MRNHKALNLLADVHVPVHKGAQVYGIADGAGQSSVNNLLVHEHGSHDLTLNPLELWDEVPNLILCPDIINL